MDAGFWKERWRARQLGFHEGVTNGLLERHISRIDGCRRVYVPLCGKAVDLAFLRERGHQVFGSEIVRSAVLELFTDLGEEAEETQVGPFRRHAGRDLTVLEGDAFLLRAEHLGGEVDAIYDRAALVALDPPTRGAYVDALTRVLRASGVLFLVALEYPQDRVKGPPWSVSNDDVHALFADRFAIELLEAAPALGGPKFANAGVGELIERAFLLRKKT